MDSTYQFNEGRFALPVDLRDRTVHMFALPGDGPSEFTLVMTRATGVEETSLDAFGKRLTTELRKGLARFELKFEVLRTVGGSPAIDMAYTWRSEGQFLYQRQVVLLTHGQEGERNALQFIATSPQALTPLWAERFESMLDSVELRDGVALQSAVDRLEPPTAAPDAFSRQL